MTLTNFPRPPEILVGSDEHQQLFGLAMANADRNADASDSLLQELDRARVVPDASVPQDVVRIGATVRYRAGEGAERTVQVVLPPDADIESARISVLTPIGTALLGLRPGQSIGWETRDGREQVLTVTSVSPASR